MKKRRRLRQEVVLIFCTLVVIICGVILVGPTMWSAGNVEIIDAEVRQKMVDTGNINDLLTSKDINIGESTKIRSLLRDKLPAGLFLSTFDITLDKLTVKYALTERSEATAEEYVAFWTVDNCQQIIMYNIGAMFVLVRNLEIIEINVEGYEYPTCIVTREAANSMFGRTLAEVTGATDWQKTLITGGVYDEDRRAAFFAERELAPTNELLQTKK